MFLFQFLPMPLQWFALTLKDRFFKNFVIMLSSLPLNDIVFNLIKILNLNVNYMP